MRDNKNTKKINSMSIATSYGSVSSQSNYNQQQRQQVIQKNKNINSSMLKQTIQYIKSLTPRLIFQSIILDILLEPILYFSLEDSLGEAYACGISSLPDAISILISSTLDSSWDPIQTVSMLVIFLSSSLTLGFHKAKLSQIPDALIPGVMGISYLISNSNRSIDKPLIFYATRPWSTTNSKFFNIKLIDENWDKTHQNWIKLKLTRVWGIVLILQSILISTLIFFLKLDTLIIVSIALSVLIALGLNLWSFWVILKVNKIEEGGENFVDIERLIDTD